MSLIIHFQHCLVDYTSRRKEIDYPNRGAEPDSTNSVPVVPPDTSYGAGGNEVLIMNTKNEDRPASFFAQPGILAGTRDPIKMSFHAINFEFIYFQLSLAEPLLDYCLRF